MAVNTDSNKLTWGALKKLIEQRGVTDDIPVCNMCFYKCSAEDLSVTVYSEGLTVETV